LRVHVRIQQIPQTHFAISLLRLRGLKWREVKGWLSPISGSSLRSTVEKKLEAIRKQHADTAPEA
jgi:hypothetical protein